MGSLGRTFQRRRQAPRLREAAAATRRSRRTTACSGRMSMTDNAHGLNTTYQRADRDGVRAGLVAVEPDRRRRRRTARSRSCRVPTAPLRDNEYTMMEYNFSLYFGLSVQLYEMTLISDDAPIDRYFEGQTSALTAKEIRGMEVFTGESACAACHSGAEIDRQLQAHPVRRGRRRRAAAGGTRRTHVQRRMRGGRLRSGQLQPRRPSHRRGSGHGRQRSVRQSADVHQAADAAVEPDSRAGAA